MKSEVLKYERRKIVSLLGICICMIFIFSLCSNYNVKNDNILYTSNGYQNKYLTNIKSEVSDEYIYLSDIPYVREQSKPGWGSIHINETDSGSNFSIKIEGAFYSFEKGIWAHASSIVVYDLTNYQNYDYFTTYTAVNSSSGNKGNGVKFYIYTSKDGENWDLKTDSNPSAVKSGDNASFIKIDIKNVKYLKLIANDNGANGNDHSVYVDAKLIKETYKEETDNLVINTSVLDEKIKKEFANASLDNKSYELILLQREFINNVGNYALKRFLTESDKNKEVYSWLINDLDALRLYVLGGQPDGGSYYNSLKELSRLYDEYSSDFTNKELLNNKWYPQMTYGDLYKKMAITLSLTHSQQVNLWMQGHTKENISDSLRRYAIFKYLHKNGKFKVTESIDITPWFESLQVEEMRYIMNNAIDDEEILWLNDYVGSNINKYPNQAWKYLTPHPYIAYVWPNYSNPVYYDEANKDYFNELFAVNGVGLFDLSYTIPGGKNTKSYTLSVTRGTSEYKLYKVWMNMRNKFGTGAVCGGISKTGSNIRTTHGIPATVIGQPGHAALLYYSKDANGKGYWNIDNDVSGWTLSEKGERLLLGWGNANTNYAKGSYQVVYMALSQEAINDYENLVKAEEEVMHAKVYQGNLKKQEEIYRKALEIQPINVDAWLGLINVYLSSNDKTEDDYYNLSLELAEKLKYYPLPMYQLTNLIKPKLTSVENSYRFTLMQTRILTEASQTPNNTADNYYVYQPGLTRLEANFLLGKMDKTIATFSFDGEDAGKIVLSSRFDKTGVRWDYSIDGKKTWKEVSFTAEEEHKIKLTDKQIDSITSENDIYIHIVGTSYDDENLYKIDILEQAAPNNIYNNDLENKVIGATNNMQWKIQGTNIWKSFEDEQPDLTGNKVVIVRNKKTGVYLTSDEKTLEYTEDIIDEKRKYIEVSHLSIEGYSTQSLDSKRPYYAPNAIDGNINTLWHTDFSQNVTQQDIKPFITIKLDNPRYISALEFIQTKYKTNDPDFIKNAIVYVSENNENWKEAGRIENCPKNNQLRNITFNESVYGQYVKIEMETYDMFASLAMVNLFEDTTKRIIPTANIEYSTKELTNQDVIARLVNPSTKLIITNNNGSDIYTFKNNGKFAFEFVDEKGNKGSEVAIVNNIDKIVPTASIEYSNTEETNESVTATLTNESEPIIILNNDGKNTYTFTKNGKFEFTYKDKAGNVGKTTATVDWIKSESSDDNSSDSENSNGSINTPDDSNQDTDDNSNTSDEEQNPGDNTNVSVDSNGEINKDTDVSNNIISDVNITSNINNINKNMPANQNIIVTEIPSQDIKYESYSVGAITIQIPSNIINEKVELKLNKLTLSKELQKKINGDNEYFEIYFENTTGEVINIESVQIKITIKVDSNKKLAKIYEILEDGTLRQLDYNKLSDNEIELETNKLGKYVISYEKENINKVEDDKENKNTNLMIIGSIAIGLILIIILIKHIKK